MTKRNRGIFMSERLIAKKFWGSRAEVLSQEILKELINTSSYTIVPHVHLKDLFPTERDTVWANFHVDFAILDKFSYPALCIEVNGPKHWNDKNIMAHDLIKKQLFAEAGIPLINIPIVELPTYDEDELTEQYKKELRFLFITFLAPLCFHTSYPFYCWKCGEILEMKINNSTYAPFYVCSNNDCSTKKYAKTFSSDEFPDILSPEAVNFLKANILVP